MGKRVTQPLYYLKGHRIVASIAWELTSEEVRGKICHLLGKGRDCNILAAAEWPDKLRKEENYRWTRDLHFTDSADCPPKFCARSKGSFTWKEYNIIDAILNFFLIATDERRYTEDVRRPCVKFLIHLFADLHNPLHVSGRERGGNNTIVWFEGHRVKLHWVWDSFMLRKRIRTDFSGSIGKYTASLQNDLLLPKKYPLFAAGFVTRDTLAEWAAEVNSINCKSVWDFAKDDDLSEEYYRKNVFEMERLLKDAAVRTAELLEAIVHK